MKKPKKVGLVHPIRTNLSLCIIFSVFALLNLRLHRRVKLLVLASSPLEFRVLFRGCHVAAAIYHHRIIIIVAAIFTTNPSPYTPPHIRRHHANPSPPATYIPHQSDFHQIHRRHQSEIPPDSSPPPVLVRVQ